VHADCTLVPWVGSDGRECKDLAERDDTTASGNNNRAKCYVCSVESSINCRKQLISHSLSNHHDHIHLEVQMYPS
jgi:hypothetical protein